MEQIRCKPEVRISKVLGSVGTKENGISFRGICPVQGHQSKFHRCFTHSVFFRVFSVSQGCEERRVGVWGEKYR